jgi:hypothetical protein
MALARTYAMALAGVQGHVVEIEADIENGLVALLLVGLPDTALREARDRIRSATSTASTPGRSGGSRSGCRRPVCRSGAAYPKPRGRPGRRVPAFPGPQSPTAA